MNLRRENISTQKLLWLTVGVVVLVNACILGKVYVNRSAMTAQLQLSERELQLPYRYGLAKEDSSARINLRWVTPGTDPALDNIDSWRWQHDRRLQLGDAHFASFQFADCAQKTRLNQKRSAWVLLEFNGRSYNNYVAQAEQYAQLMMESTAATPTDDETELATKRKEANEFLTTAKTTSSRLFVIDAAAERELLEAVLRVHKPIAGSQLLIAPAELRPDYYRCEDDKKHSTEVLIDNLAVESLYIPQHLASQFPVDDSSGTNATFTVWVNYGRLYEPWISNLP